MPANMHTRTDTSDLCQRSNEVRQERARIRRALGNGSLKVTDVLREKPDALREATVSEVLLMGQWFSRGKLAELNARAVEHGVNLMVRVADVPEATVLWLECRLPKKGRPKERDRPKQAGEFADLVESLQRVPTGRAELALRVRKVAGSEDDPVLLTEALDDLARCAVAWRQSLGRAA